ncbi:MAG TPA: hypothetical protein VK943_15150, partial [Arenibaculum sp.]|nr:hypothetical protein [Arenibaculum sp.]
TGIACLAATAVSVFTAPACAQPAGGAARGAIILPGQPADASMTDRVLHLVEAQLGRPLSDDERTRCLDAGQRASSAMRERDLMFVHAVADLLRLAPEQVSETMPPAVEVDVPLFDDEMRPKVEQILGRSITPSEIRDIRALGEKRTASLRPVRFAYAKDLAEVTGIAPDVMVPLLHLAGM